MSHSHLQTTVILNSFQDPFLRTRGSFRQRTDRAAHTRELRRMEARWTLKQVQGDEIGGGVK